MCSKQVDKVAPFHDPLKTLKLKTLSSACVIKKDVTKMPLLIYYDELYMLHSLISAIILETKCIIEVKGSNLRSVHPAIHAVPAMIHLARLSGGKELPQFQHFRSTKTSNKFLNAWGKMISAVTLLDENMFVACMKRLHL